MLSRFGPIRTCPRSDNVPMHMWRNSWRSRIGTHIESPAIQQPDGRCGPLDSTHHRREQLPIQGVFIHKPSNMGFRYHYHMDLGYGSRVAERQYQIVLINPFHFELS